MSMEHDINPINNSAEWLNKTKHDKRSESEKLQDDLEPIWHSTRRDKSDEIEDAKKII
jgi:hypothetical protein